MRNTSLDWVQMSEVAIVKQIGSYIKHMRLQQNTENIVILNYEKVFSVLVLARLPLSAHPMEC
jgi:hypothetical protein